jgi:hypothetical protein
MWFSCVVVFFPRYNGGEIVGELVSSSVAMVMAVIVTTKLRLTEAMFFGVGACSSSSFV